MKQGVVVFAFNNESTDYVSMAAWCARRVNQYLDLPVTLVTNQTVDNPVFDQVIVINAREPTSRWYGDYGKSVAWYNANRIDAFALSPYDQTLVIDSDYVVCGDQLRLLFSTSQSFLCHRWAIDAANNENSERANFFGRHKMPMSWATVIYFERTAMAESVFDMMTMIKNNWNHYRNLYGVAEQTYRNDYSISIAQHVIHGHWAEYPSIPWNLVNLDPEYKLSQIDVNEFQVEFVKDKKAKFVHLKNQDFHAMGKKSLGEIIASSR